eukprot:TRINITY_DN594_c0_g1_i3.p1 TRINITY_DN594_c0_g1~~TRINITY_DN594_c0_g1_i3.p1  ORF type:complete len:345 (-),score=65.06 TRINITY_DN594_c0_g1_i3:524-1516(-)
MGAVECCGFKLPVPRPAEGVLEPNQLLRESSTLLFQGITLPGEGGTYHSPLRPESFAETEEGIYTGLGNGYIALITSKDGRYEMSFVNRTGRSSEMCGKEEMEKYCGRPLGLHYDKTTDSLFIADTLGLLQMDLKTKHLHLLADQWQGHKIRFPNSIAVSRDGLLYLTDSSRKFARCEVMYETIEGCPNGRLFQYDLKTGQMALLLQGLHFPNGLQLTPEQDSLLIAETTRARILKYKIATGTVTTFLENCPGFPDNIRYSPYSNVYWVGLSSARFLKEEPDNFVLRGLGLGRLPLGDLLGPFPFVRDVIARLMSMEMFIRLLPRYGLLD